MDSPCPDERDWDELAVGLTTGERAEKLIEHASWCTSCAVRLRAAIEVFRPEEPATLAQPDQPRSPGNHWRVYVAAAAMLATMTTAGLWYWQHHHRPDPLQMLATAYSRDRNLELRLVGAPYGVMRSQRKSAGGLVEQPSELLEAAVLIQNELRRAPDNPVWLHAKGRLALLQWRTNEAIEAFQEARDNGNETPSLLIDMASAYYERAKQSDSAADLTKALDLLGQAIQTDPMQPSALFNRALVEEELNQIAPAITDLERLVAIERDGRWNEEARRNLERLRAKRSPSGTRSDHFPETELDRALRAGIGSGMNTWAKSLDRAGLAECFRLKHGDSWFGELLAVANSPRNRNAIRVLSEMADIRITVETGRYAAIKQAFDRLNLVRLDPPLAAWKQFEDLFRATHARGEFRCSPGAMSNDDIRKHPWLSTQLLREAGYCSFQQGDIDQANQFAIRSIALATQHHFPVAAVRSQALLAHVENRRGRFRQSFNIAKSALETIARDDLPIARSHEFHNLIMSLSESLNRWYSARTAAAALTDVAALAGFRDLQFTNKVRWAQLSLRCGDSAEASQLFASAMQYYSTLAPNDDQPWAAVGFAEATNDESLLAPFAAVLEQRHDSIVWVPYQRVRAQLAFDRGRIDEARSRLVRVFQWLSEGRGSTRFSSGRWRAELERAADLSLYLTIEEHKYGEAFEFLQRERLAEEFRPSVPLQTADEKEALTFSFTMIRGRIAAWRIDRGVPEFRWSPVGGIEVVRLIRCLHRLLRSPDGRQAEITAKGQALRDALFGDWLGSIPPDRPLLIQLSRDLRNLPIAALPGRVDPLGLEHPLAVTTLAVSERSQPGVRGGSGFLLVDASAAGAEVSDLPPLPNAAREISEIAASVPDGAMLLRGRAATREALVEVSSHARLLHFAGHATVAGSDAVLVLPSLKGSSEWLPWTGARVRSPYTVVLSACSTGRSIDENTDSDSLGSLAGAFLHQGAAEVIGSQWDVDSPATQLLMTHFYRELTRGASTGLALTRAMARVRNTPGFGHPYFWAAFTRFVRT